MSDEGDDDDPQVVILHPPLWRSKSKFTLVSSKVNVEKILIVNSYVILYFFNIALKLTFWPSCRSFGVNQILNVGLIDFLHRLDGRYEERVKKDGTIMAKKQRKIGAPSSYKPPADAPDWTIDAQWRQQQSTHSIIHNLCKVLMKH